MGVFVKRHAQNVALCYHGCVATRAEVQTYREHFDDWVSHIKYLQAGGYTFVLPSQYYSWITGGYSPPTPIACCTIDDGLAGIDTICNYMIKNAIPFGLAIIGRRQRLKSPEDGFAGWADLKTLFASGIVEIINHTFNMHHLCLVKQASGAILSSPIMEGPCWIDNGDVIYRLAGDTRFYWDFTFVDTGTLGFPLIGSDPNSGFTTPLTSSITFTAKATFTCTQLRLWAALGRPFGAGYDANVKIRIKAGAGAFTQVFLGLVSPVQYPTRSQWPEREFITITLDSSYALTSGTVYTVSFETQNAGPGALLIYGIPDVATGFTAVTNSISLTPGQNGPLYADYPPNVNWPIRPCIIFAGSAGASATELQYETYVAADLAANNTAIQNLLPAVWTRQQNKTPVYTNPSSQPRTEFPAPPGYSYGPQGPDAAGYSETAQQLAVVAIAGTYTDGTTVDTIIQYIPPASVTLEVMRVKYARVDTRYSVSVNVSYSASSSGPWTPCALWIPNWFPFHWQEFDLSTPIAATAGTPIWFRFTTLNASPWHTLGFPRQIATIYMEQPLLPDIGFNDPAVVVAALAGKPTTVIVTENEMSDLWPNGFTTGPGGFFIYTFGTTTIGGVFIDGFSKTTTPGSAPTQIAYPFGSYADQGNATAHIVNKADISAGLKSVLAGAGVNCGYTVFPNRYDVQSVFREPDCRYTQWVIGRLLVLGTNPPATTLNNVGAYTGLAYEDAQHTGVRWLAYMEPDPAGNATVRNSVQAIDWVGMDAYYVRASGVIQRQAMNDGGIYIEFTGAYTGTFTVGETVTGGTSGAHAVLDWATTTAVTPVLKVHTVVGTFVAGETLTGGTSGAHGVIDADAALVYAGDKAWLQARGVPVLLLISNFNDAIGVNDFDPALATAAFAAASTYVTAITAIITGDNWDGVLLDFEAAPQAQRANATTFFTLLANTLHAAGKQCHLTVPAATGTGYDDPTFVGWCDFTTLITLADSMHVQTYTEAGDGTNPAPLSPQWHFEAVYSYLRSIVAPFWWSRILVGSNLYGQRWPSIDTPGVPTSADYVTFHQGQGDAITAGAFINPTGPGFGTDPTQVTPEYNWAANGTTEWFGGEGTETRALKMAAKYFGGIGFWKADDGDLYEHWPVWPQLGRFTSMAFVEQQFPTQWSWNRDGGPNFKTYLNQVESGNETRNPSWTFPLHQFKLKQGVTPAGHDATRSFFMLRQGKAIGFRFQDSADYSALAQQIGIGDGSTLAFQLIKIYSFTDAVNGSNSTMSRKILKPVPNTVNVYKNGVLQVSGFTVNTTTGIVSFSVAPAGGVVITADYQFDVPCRFDNDFWDVSFDGVEFYDLSNISIVELRNPS